MKMISKIENLLKKNLTKKDFLFLAQFENNYKDYQKLKEEFLNLNRDVTEKFKLFLFSIALDFADKDIVYILIEDIQNSKLIRAKVLLGNFYTRISHYLKALEYYNEAFNKDYKKFRIKDISLYLELLFNIAFFKRYEEVLAFLLKNEDRREYRLYALIYQVNTLHKNPSNLNVIKHNLSVLEKNSKNYQEFYTFAYCYYHIGMPEKAFEAYNFYYQNLKLKHLKRVFPNKFSVPSVTESLNGILRTIYKEGFDAFIVGGTLLGFIREGKLLEHDKDADIGLFVNDYDTIYKIVEKICKGTDYIAPDMVKRPKEFLEWNVAIIDTKRKVSIDLFFYKESIKNKGKKTIMYDGIWTRNGVLKWIFTPFELKKVEFNDFDYFIPKNYDLYLKELFGDWRKPVKIWDTLLNAYNITSDSKNAVLYYSLQRMNRAIMERNVPKIENYIKGIESWGHKFGEKTLKNLQNILKDIEDELT